ncbi:MAG: hypothetical protein PV362_19410 [Providencia heimbachae]|nr:hypothetical protein [Providencia heimbachae]
MRSFPDPVFTPVAENIKANREDERKSLMNRFADRQRKLADKILNEKSNYIDAYHLVMSEAEYFENQAAELNHV